VRRKIMNIVLKATPQPNGTIEIETVEGKKFVCSAIRGGISWPLLSKDMPAYYCILGEEWTDRTRFQGQEAFRGKLKFLCEYEAINYSLGSLFVRLTDDIRLSHCSTIYGIIEADQDDRYKGFPNELYKVVHDKDISVVPEQAPFAENPNIAIPHLIDWYAKGLLDLPEESLLRQQLKGLKPEDAKDVAERLNAVNAGRFVVCGFERDRPNLRSKDWRKRVKRGSWRSV
jgi:hypothetical protein